MGEVLGVFLNDWQDKDQMAADFELEPSEIEHVNVLLASYGADNYMGDAFVLFRDTRDGKLYEVHGSHCSCYGLEGQWEPEACDLAALKHRLTEGYLGSDDFTGNEFADELKQVLAELEG